MKKNMGSVDKIVRVLIAIVIAVFYWQGIISGALAIVLLTVGAIFLITSLISSCPLYSIVGIKTCKSKE
ncbi:MAG: hypothetical protein COC22_06900 [Flavobacteriaceae bacterium]|nr:MAG: hypothetical protein COC22_06900 [Flavobacteriaceae bacterium]